MKNELIAFSGFEGTDTQKIKLSRTACALYLNNRGYTPISLRIGVDGRHYHEFMIRSETTFKEMLPPFNEILITLLPEYPDKTDYPIDAYYVGYPYYRG